MRILLGVTASDMDCGLKLFSRQLVDGLRLEATGAMISAELMVRLVRRGAKICEVEVSHLPRVAGKQSGANPKVVMRAFKELVSLYRSLHRSV
jgi:hypothetical protein